MVSSKNKLFYTIYSEEILRTLFVGEQKRKMIDFKSKNKDKRETFVTLMKHVSSKYSFSVGTLALGIHIIDVFMDTYILSDNEEHQSLVVVVALLLAAKTEDIDFRIPSLKDLLEFFNVDEFTDIFRSADRMSNTELSAAFKKFSKLYVKLEFHIFKTMDFSLICPTVVSFLTIYNADLVSEEDYRNNSIKFESLGDLKATTMLRVNEILDIVLSTLDFANAMPSYLAASIIGAARKTLGILPFWTQDIQTITKYTFEEIEHMVIDLIHLFIEFEKRNDIVELVSTESSMGESGYGSTFDLTSSAESLNGITPKKAQLDTKSVFKKAKLR